MSSTLVVRPGVLERKIAEQPGSETWQVSLDEHEAEAVLYPEIVGAVAPGDRVLLNTTAVELALGTGGQHFVICRLEVGGPVPPARISTDDGHIIKLRYTPLQLRVMAAEEQASPYHDALREADSLPGTPVVCLGLHSQLAPVIGGIRAANPDLRIAYVMTDGGALPLAYSQLVAGLKRAGLLDLTITTGQAFGGDLEAVNLYSALVTAAVVGKADIIIAGQGPGNAGTATALGFGGVEQAMLLNAAAALGGTPIAVPRISFADPRDRHRGLSHHTLTVLRRLTLAPVTLALPFMDAEHTAVIGRQRMTLTHHTVSTADGAPGIAACREAGIPLRSMGRGYDDDPAFFLAAAAAGRVAAECLPDA